MRNKIYVTTKMPHEQQEQCCYIDVGKILPTVYKTNPEEFKNESQFDSFCYFRKIVDSHITSDKTRIVFSNFGILLEKDFALDVPRFFLEYAKDYQVFILQESLIIIDGTALVWNVENPHDKIEFMPGILDTRGGITNGLVQG